MSTDIVTASCVRHGDHMFGCTVMVNGRVVAFVDGQMSEGTTLDEIEANVVTNRRRIMAEPGILTPHYAQMIHDRRIAQRISLRDVAQKLNVTAAHVSDMERGIKPPHSFRFAFMWAMFSGMPHDEASELFGVNGNEVLS